MGLLDSIFGSSKKNSTTNTTQATQNTSNISNDGDGFLAQDSNVTIDNSQTLDYRLTDSRDLSTNLLDGSKRNSDNSSYSTYSSREASTWTDNSVTNDSRSTSTISYDLTPDVIKAALSSLDKAMAGTLSNVNNSDSRRSGDTRYAIDGAYNNSLAFFNTSSAALRDAYDTNAENLAENSERVLDAVVEANRTDGQALVDTVNKFGKYAALIVGGIIVVSFLRSA